jgi:hypothetical protein
MDNIFFQNQKKQLDGLLGTVFSRVEKGDRLKVSMPSDAEIDAMHEAYFKGQTDSEAYRLAHS